MCPSREAPSVSGSVSITGAVGRVEGDIVGGNKITGLSEERLVAVLEEKGLLRVAEQSGLERQTIIKLAQRLKPEEALDFDQAVTELERAVAVALDVIGRGMSGTGIDDFVDAVLAGVAQQTRIGNFDDGADAIDEGLAKLAAEYRRSRITLLEEGIKVDTLRRDAVSVARRIETIIGMDTTDRTARLASFRQRYDDYFEDGDVRGVNFSLFVAIELSSRMIASAHDGTERGDAALLLGNALLRLGQREVETARLEAAVVTFQDALKGQTREREPLKWAATQNNLGTALRSLGERQAGTARLEEAIVHYRAALEERTRESVPLDWAVTQNNLGNALARLGEREAGTGSLEEAATAYRSALEEQTRERAPLVWAWIQGNLGNVLALLATREAGTQRLEQAVYAYRKALEEQTRDRVPLDWAMTQNNLGNALLALGQREAGTGRLEEAVVAYRSALEERERDRVPLSWAITQSNLGNVLRVLGERETGAARLEEAIASYLEALEELTPERAPQQWATTLKNLEIALLRLSERLGF